MLLRLLRGSMFGVGLILLLLLLLIGGFRLAAALRESRSRHDAAPAGGRFVRAGGLEIFVQEQGPPDGPAVLLVHGTGAWSDIWRATMSQLAGAGFRVVALDLPPFGFSERPGSPAYQDASQADRIVGVLDALEISRVSLVGHSFGARPTVEAALRNPGRVRALVLVDAALGLQATGNGQPPLLLRLLLGNGMVREVLVSLTMTNPLLTRRLLQQLILDPNDATDSAVVMVKRQFPVRGTTPALAGWLQQFLLGHDPSLASQRSQYSRLGMPVLVLWGEADSITPLPQAKDLLTLLPKARLEVLEKSGHIPLIEDGPRFNQAVLSFLRQQGN